MRRRSGVLVRTSKTWIRPERSEAARREPSERKETEETTSVKEEMVWVRARVLGEKREREAEWAAAKGWGGEGEKAREGTEKARLSMGWVLKEDQYLDSGVFEGVLGLGLSFGFTGKVLETKGSSIDVMKLFWGSSSIFGRLMVSCCFGGFIVSQAAF